MEFDWWHWAVLGIVLIIAELAVPQFVLIWFGLGALVVALLQSLLPLGDIAQVAAWIIASVAMVLLWFRVFKNRLHTTRVGLADAALGETGVLVGAVEPYTRGSVRFQKPLLGAEVWECIADESIPAGERVRVVAVEGSFLKVGKAHT
ncbi:MAG: NfeD family protein [Rhodocyclaceae bacterium]|nr:NfeD family protein [Rhodocyclaceae bacterium]MBX3667519.1 NfeD family protein [Rhodocyclaceae bacterium]